MGKGHGKGSDWEILIVQFASASLFLIKIISTIFFSFLMNCGVKSGLEDTTTWMGELSHLDYILGMLKHFYIHYMNIPQASTTYEAPD